MDTKVSNTQAPLSSTIFGSTGLIGSHLKELLKQDNDFNKIHLPSRSLQDVELPSKFEIETVDFENLDHYGHLFNVDVVFICLGTTMKKAGSKAAFEKVDKHIVHEIAKLSRSNNCPKLLMISSAGADPRSSNFYLKTKGEVEELVRKDGPDQVAILRPSLLLGVRKEFRFGERLAQWLMPPLSFLMLGRYKDYRPIKGSTVAKAMQILSKQDLNQTVLFTHQIKSLVATNQ